MRILFFSNTFPNPINPTKGTFNLSLVRALARQHPVHVFSPVTWVEELTARLRRNERVAPRLRRIAGNVTADYPCYYYTPRLFRADYGRFMAWSVGRSLAATFERFQPDAVVAYWTHPDGDVAVRAARKAGIPAVVMVGGSDVLLLGRRGKRREIILNVLREADAVVPVSRNIATVLEADGIPKSKLHVIYRGVDQALFSPGDRDEARRHLNLARHGKLLVAVGRLVPVKGFDVLIDALRRLAVQHTDFECHIIGNGPLESALRGQIDAAGLADRVKLPGARPQTELPDWYRAADLTVLASHSEGVPNVLLESICCGTPFVATNVGGVHEIADERCHSMVPPGDAPALFRAIESRLYKSGPAVSPWFVPGSWDDSAAQLVALLERCGARDASLVVQASRLSEAAATAAPECAGIVREECPS